MDNSREILPSFVVLEGLDGSGTTTQAELLSRRLKANGARVLATCEPSRGPVGAFIRGILKKEVAVEPCTLAHLFAADRNEHLCNPENGMLAHLRNGGVVVCDRYLFSSLAYQSVGCSYELVAGLNARFPLPELLVYLDVTPEECQRRLSGRPGLELFESLAIQQQIVDNYERGMVDFSHPKMKVVRVDGSASIEAVAENIWSALSTIPIEKM